MKERLAPSMQQLTYESCLPTLKDYCQIGNFELFPYVEHKGETPEDGIVAFNDLPRYAMGYASLFHSLSFTVETHMLKPFPQRVKATLQFMNSTIAYMMSNATQIEQARKEAKNWSQQQSFFRFNYQLDEQNVDSIRFKGYKATYPIHPITGLAQLEYDRSQPYEKYIPYYRHYLPQDSVRVPTFYIVGAQESQIISYLKLNGVQFQTLETFSIKNVYCQVVKDYKAPTRPYEGHFKLSQINVETTQKEIQVKPGDIIIPTQQDRALFIHSVLQGEAEDSYLSWNFFDSYLQQKEYFSSYVFKENVARILEENLILKSKYEERKALDVQFAKSEWEQLYFIYQNSPYFEPSFMRLPIYEVY
jgi:hypothetical protein